MIELFLTSSVSFVARDIATRISTRDKKLAFIYTAAEAKEGGLHAPWNDVDRQSLVNMGFQVEPYTITGKTREEIQKALTPFDVIYMSGGDTIYLLKQSQESGFITLIKAWVEEDHKTYISTSAGSIIAGEKCPDYLLKHSVIKQIDSLDGYGLVNFTVLPHWGSDDFKDKYLNFRLKQAYVPNQGPLITLTDSQYIHVQDYKMEIIDVNRGNHV